MTVAVKIIKYLIIYDEKKLVKIRFYDGIMYERNVDANKVHNIFTKNKEKKIS